MKKNDIKNSADMFLYKAIVDLNSKDKTRVGLASANQNHP